MLPLPSRVEHLSPLTQVRVEDRGRGLKDQVNVPRVFTYWNHGDSESPACPKNTS